MDTLAEPAEFSCCSSGAVCITSYRQRAETDILEARNNKDINWFIVFNLNIYYRQEDCAILGYYAASRVNLIPTFRNNLSHIQGSFSHIVIVLPDVSAQTIAHIFK